VGTVLPKGEGAALDFRAACLLAGLPQVGAPLLSLSISLCSLSLGVLLTPLAQEVPVRSVNRLCSSGLQAIADAASAIRAGYTEIAIAAVRQLLRPCCQMGG
jgi:3-oxoacyl-(acyl-carrier-protein) synthase